MTREVLRSKRLYVTGALGFVGRHLSRAAAEVGPSAECRPERPAASWTTVNVGDGPDLRDRQALRDALAAARPDRVIHLAAQSFVPDALKDPRGTFEVNFQGTWNLLDALVDSGFSGRMLFVGSGDEYGLVDEKDLPVSESQPLRPRNPYAVSKVAAEALCHQWSQTGSFEIVMARPFNHIGPGQSTRFAVSDFAHQIAEMSLGRRQPVLTAGDLSVTRDFTDVRDVVLAYLALLEHGHNGEVYNVCSGREVALREVVEVLASLAGIEVDVKTDPGRVRRTEQRRMLGSAAKLHAATGWTPSLSIHATLRDTLDWWKTELTS